MPQPLYSIIIPAYNAQQWLDSCLNSVKQLKGSWPWEVLIIDDGSEDDTLSIAQKRAACDGRIKVIAQDNKGISQARNRGIDEAKGEYLLFLDADDELMPNIIECFESFKGNADIVELGISEGFDSPGSGNEKSRFHVTSGKEALKEMLYKSGNLASVCGKRFKRALFQGCRFVPDQRYEDVEIMARIYLRVGAVAVSRATVGYFYRKAPHSFLNSFSPSRLDILKVTSEIEQRFINNPELLQAARNRRFAANFNILLMLEKEKPHELEEIKQQCFQVICELRNGALTSSQSRTKIRLGAVLSFLGRFPLKLASTHYVSR